MVILLVWLIIVIPSRVHFKKSLTQLLSEAVTIDNTLVYSTMKKTTGIVLDTKPRFVVPSQMICIFHFEASLHELQN
jgi:hypothetical protein